MKTTTLIFRIAPDDKETLKKQFEASYERVKKAYYDSRVYGNKTWDRYKEHPKSLGEWVLNCAKVESAARTKNLKALAAKKK